MLVPDKHFHLSNSLLLRTSGLIEILVQDKYMPFKSLYEKYKLKFPEADFQSFILCLNLLYSLGKIFYSRENDLIGLKKNEIK